MMAQGFRVRRFGKVCRQSRRRFTFSHLAALNLLGQHGGKKRTQRSRQRLLLTAFAEVGSYVFRVFGKIQNLDDQILVGRFQTTFFNQAFGKFGILLMRTIAQGGMLLVLQLFQFRLRFGGLLLGSFAGGLFGCKLLFQRHRGLLVFMVFWGWG